jgi:hypothetical protein
MQAWQKHVGHKSYELLANAVMPEQSMLSSEVAQCCEPGANQEPLNVAICKYVLHGNVWIINKLSPVPLRHSQRLIWQSQHRA